MEYGICLIFSVAAPHQGVTFHKNKFANYLWGKKTITFEILVQILK